MIDTKTASLREDMAVLDGRNETYATDVDLYEHKHGISSTTRAMHDIYSEINKQLVRLDGCIKDLEGTK